MDIDQLTHLIFFDEVALAFPGKRAVLSKEGAGTARTVGVDLRSLALHRSGAGDDAITLAALLLPPLTFSYDCLCHDKYQHVNLCDRPDRDVYICSCGYRCAFTGKLHCNSVNSLASHHANNNRHSHVVTDHEAKAESLKANAPSTDFGIP